jgi:hypothetical protein
MLTSPLQTRITKHTSSAKVGEISEFKIAEQSRDMGHKRQWNIVEVTHKEENRIIMKVKG